MADIGQDHVLLFGGRDGNEDPTTWYGDTWVYAIDDLIPPTAIGDLTATLAGSAIHLDWTAITEDTLGNPITVERYNIYRNASPTFSPSSADSIGSTTNTFYDDPTPALKNPSINHYYVVRAVDSAGKKSADSNRVGEYDTALATTAGTDYTWISLPMGTSGLDSASHLEAHLEVHSSPATNCLTISEWNASAQTYTHYTTMPIPMGDFPLQTGQACRVEMTNDAVWTLVGDVLAPDSISFDLKTTTGTDYTWISLPVNLDGLGMASDLEAHIQNNSNPSTDCLTISEWNATAQAYTHYTTIPIPMGDFAISLGRPYRVEVTADAAWPYLSKSPMRLQQTPHLR
jgi:hypothetical protein